MYGELLLAHCLSTHQCAPFLYLHYKVTIFNLKFIVSIHIPAIYHLSIYHL